MTRQAQSNQVVELRNQVTGKLDCAFDLLDELYRAAIGTHLHVKDAGIEPGEPPAEDPNGPRTSQNASQQD